MFSLIGDYSDDKLMIFGVFNVLIFALFIPVMLTLKQVLNQLASYHGVDKLIIAYIWGNISLFLLSILIFTLYKFEYLSGLSAILYGLTLFSVIYLLLPILAIVIGVRLKSCNHLLFGLRDPIRFSFMWFGILSLSFILSELAIMASWFNSFLLLVLFIKFKNYFSIDENKKSTSISTSGIWGLLFLSIVASVASYSSVFLLNINDKSFFEYFFDSDEDDENQRTTSIETVSISSYDLGLNSKLQRLSMFPSVSYFRGDNIWLLVDSEMMHSSDLGQTFDIKTMPINGKILSLQFEPNMQRGLVVSKNGKLVLTVDGGKSWDVLDLYDMLAKSRDEYWSDISFFQFDEQLINGMMIFDCDLWITNNGWKNWEKSSVNISENEYCVTNVFEEDDSIIWIEAVEASSNYSDISWFWKSDDLGVSWEIFCERNTSYYKRKSSADLADCANVENDLPSSQEKNQNNKYSEDELEYFRVEVEQNRPVNIEIEKISSNDYYFKTDSSMGRIWYLDDGLKYSNDFGASWVVISNHLQDESEIIWADDSGNAIALYECEILSSNDFGKNWITIYKSLNDYCDKFIFVDKKNKNILFHSQVELFSYQALTKDVSSLLKLKDDEFLRAASSLDGNNIAALTYDGVLYYSNNGGDNFESILSKDDKYEFVYCINSCFIIQDDDLFELHFDVSNNELRYVAKLPIDKSKNKYSGEVIKVLFNHSGKKLWIQRYDKKTIYSHDGGISWNESENSPKLDNLLWYDEENNHLWGTRHEQGLFRSENGGVSFERFVFGDTGEILDLCVGKNSTLVLGRWGASIFIDDNWLTIFLASENCLFTDEYLWLSDRTYRLDSF